jgi:hypothetical protein
MDRALSTRYSPLAIGVISAALFAAPSQARAQAWMPPAGVGSVSVSIQQIRNTGHLLTDGSRLDDGKSVDASIYIEAEYALTDRVSLSAGLPFVFAKYIGPGPTPFNFLPVDACHCWHGGWQDFAMTARYSVTKGWFGLAPSVSAGVPSHDYDFRGEASLGRNLKELRVAVDAGQRLDAISPRLSIQERYSYAFVERVLGIANNRSNATLEGTFLLTRRLPLRGLLSWQHTHGGLRFGSPPPADVVFPGEVNTPDRLLQHDRLLRDNNWRAGAAAAYSFPLVDVFGSYIEYLRGTDSHAGRVVTVGVSWPFEFDWQR